MLYTIHTIHTIHTILYILIHPTATVTSTVTPILTHPFHPTPPIVLSHIEAILETCLEESDTSNITQDMMESLLLPLIPSNKTESPVSYTLVQAVLRRCTIKLQNSLNSYINNLMATTLANADEDTHTTSSSHSNTNAEVLCVCSMLYILCVFCVCCMLYQLLNYCATSSIYVCISNYITIYMSNYTSICLTI